MSLEQLGGETIPCEQQSDCFNSPIHRGQGQASCYMCKLADHNGGSSILWKPWDKKLKHPKLVQIAREKNAKKVAEILAKKKSIDPKKQILASRAARAEKQTERQIIKATKNSGRSNKDGDHVSAGKITLDTKLQTGNLNPVVKLVELDKVRGDAKRAGNPIGALVLRNKEGRGVVVLDENDYALLVTQLVVEYARQIVEG